MKLLKNQLLFCISRKQDINSFLSSLPFLKDITRMGCLDIHKRNSHFYPKDNCEMTIKIQMFQTELLKLIYVLVI